MVDRPSRRVVVTGMGATTSLGNDVETIWQNILKGASGVREIRQFDGSSFPVHIASEVDLEQIHLEDINGLAPLLSRPVQFGIWSLEQAWKDAELSDSDIDPWRSGVLVGALNFPVFEHTVVAQRLSVLTPDNYYDAKRHMDLCREMPELLAQRHTGTIATMLSARHCLKGASLAIQTACASATQAIGEAYQMIRCGEADLMVTGGTDSMLSAFCVIGFTLLGVPSAYSGDPAKASRPFDRKRDGLVLGEGAGIVILEELEHAQQRGARIYAEIIGYGSSCEGYRFTDAHPDGLGAIRCMTAALQDAGIEPSRVDYINAHGTATPQNDQIETKAIKQVFGEHAYRTPISSTKSELGHLICAAGGIELILTVQAIRNSIAPPTINLDYPDPNCDLDYIPHEPRPMQIKVALSNSFGFGGQNGTLLISSWDAEAA